jgi:methyltransferase NSUN6
VRLLKRNGHLVYSTCTITKDECENTIAWALKKFPELSLMPAEPLLGGIGCEESDLTLSQRYFFHRGIHRTLWCFSFRMLVQRFGPDDSSNRADPIYNDSIGFFIALFKKM